MTSGIFSTAPISSITILPDRQRKTVDEKKDQELRESIARLGLIHPIVVDRDHVLIAGFRRLSRCRELGWTSIPFQYADDLSEIEREDIEFEENVRRQDLTWQEQHDVLVAFHTRRKEGDPEWTGQKTASAADINPRFVSEHLLVEKFKSNEKVAKAESFSKAVNEAKRLAARASADAWTNEHDLQHKTHTSGPIHADFHEWAPTYSGPKFNLIHCDFPYGINSQASGSNPSGYDDRPEVYWELLKTLSLNLDRFCAPSAHLLFWCSANIEIASNTFQLLKLLDDFVFDEVPLIWVKSDGKGIAPDPQRRFRRVYELAFFGWRGDRRHSLLKDNAFASQSVGDHPHTKPIPVLQHFFSGLVDRNTRLLDPTCGSGTALQAGILCGAGNEAVLGLERNEEYFADARRHFDAFLRGG